MSQDVTKIKDINILYVEDDDIIRNNLYMMLKKMYGTVYVAADGIEGLNIFKKYPNIDIIVSDINMPNLDGLEMIEKIKEINPNIKTILTTAHSDSDFLIKSINLGINSFITKPISIVALFKTIYDLYIKIKSTDIIVTKTKENSNLMDVLDSIAITIELDNEFNITRFNKKYEEIVDIEKDFLENLTLESKNLILKDLENNKIFSNKITFLNDEHHFYTKTFIIPTKENGYLKYLVISFEDENYLKLREDNKNKMSLISKERLNTYSKIKEIDNLNNNIKKLETMIISKNFEPYIKELKDKNLILNDLNDNYLKEIRELEKKVNLSNMHLVEKLKHQMMNQSKIFTNLKDDYEKTIHSLSLQLKMQKEYEKEIKDLTFKNKNLYDLVEDFEKEINKLKKESKNK